MRYLMIIVCFIFSFSLSHCGPADSLAPPVESSDVVSVTVDTEEQEPDVSAGSVDGSDDETSVEDAADESDLAPVSHTDVIGC